MPENVNKSNIITIEGDSLAWLQVFAVYIVF